MSQSCADLSPVILREIQAMRKETPGSTPTKVPNMCSNDLRQAYKALVKADPTCAFSLGKDDKQEDNVKTTRRLIKAVRDIHGGVEQCQYTIAMLEGAAKRYYKSLRDAERRKEKGKVKQHTDMSRRQNRKREKCERLLKSLKTTKAEGILDFVEKRTIEGITSIMKPEYMSSEESDRDDEGEVKRIVVRKLEWMKPSVQLLKDSLMEDYMSDIPSHLKHLFKERFISDDFSSRPIPNDCPRWVLKKNFRPHK